MRKKLLNDYSIANFKIDDRKFRNLKLSLNSFKKFKIWIVGY